MAIATIQNPFRRQMFGPGSYAPGAMGVTSMVGRYPVTIPTPSPNGIIQIPRSTQQNDQIQKAFTTRSANAAQGQQTMKDFVQNYLGTKPQAQAYTNQETAAIGNFYGEGPGSVAAKLADIESRRANAVNSAAQSAIRQAALNNNLRRRMSGNNSANDRAYSQMLADIAAGTAKEKAMNDAANYRYVLDNQTRLGGQRNRLLDELLKRDFQPADYASRLEANDLASLGTLSNLENQNSYYDDTLLRRQLLNSLMN